MPPARLARFLLRCPLALVLPLQAVLLLPHLGLLPVWTDERFTMATIERPPARIIHAVHNDIHPPLYFLLLHGWMQAPLPGNPVARARAFSVLWALLATLAVDCLWLRRERAGTRWWFLGLWTLSPCLLLYARMARSYSMQLSLTAVALYAACRFLRQPADKPGLLFYVTSAAVLLYTHYVPGAALVAAVGLLLIWRLIRSRDRTLALPLALSNLALLAVYLPWLASLSQALGRWVEQSGVYRLTADPWLETGVKLAYGFISFSFGESLPLWVVVAGIVLAPAILWLLVRGARSAAEWLPLALIVAVLGFLAVSRWTSFPFVPARLLFLLPFFFLVLLRGRERHPILGTAVAGALVVASIGSLASYFRKEDFLNKGYAAPFDEMAALVNRSADGRHTLVIVDPFNTDALPLLDRLRRDTPVVLVRDRSVLQKVDDALTQGAVKTVWYLRTAHDISPGGLNRKLETELARSCQVRRHLFQPYSPVERLLIRRLGWPEQPTHFYQVLEMHCPPGPAAAR